MKTQVSQSFVLYSVKKKSQTACAHHSILGCLDALINDLPPRALQSAQKVAIVGALADDLLQRQVAM